MEARARSRRFSEVSTGFDAARLEGGCPAGRVAVAPAAPPRASAEAVRARDHAARRVATNRSARRATSAIV